ncbi:MAG: pyruvate:ferredoxin (flavodoxin) oxidoreductase [Azoarcus sp.]|nr:pyruvate:ferredoxin (flavodoxin) oxidoreductase [Azoarcus sp.]
MARTTRTMDGNAAAAYVSYAFTDVAAIYPITPSSNMAEETDKMAANGIKNLFGQPVIVKEMQSEAGAAGAVHGALAAGALTTTYTASQGLLLMIPNMYKMAGELLPAVIHVSSRAVAAHALSIFGDHSDVYACRQTGFAMLCSTNPQEAMDLGAAAHLSAIEGSLPFLHFFDGFRTSHELQKIEIWDYEDLDEMLDRDALNAWRRRALNPEHPVQRGSAQNSDIFFQAREASNRFHTNIVGVCERCLDRINAKIGSDYKLFNYYGASDADKVIVAMGSVCDTIEETLDYLNGAGEKVGLIKVRLYRPFSVEHLLAAIPASVKKITVLDRTKEPGSLGEPLYLDVVAALRDGAFEHVPVFGGRYGLASKDTTPAQIVAVVRNMEAASPKKRFTIGIHDDVTYLSLDVTENPDTTPEGTRSCKFWGLGADGTVGANKNAIKIIGDNTDLCAQGYFSYDSKKSGGVTVSHLRFGKHRIKSTYLISQADFVACHNPSYVHKYDIVEDIKPGGVFLLNCSWRDDELSARLPARMKRLLARNGTRMYTIDATGIAAEIGMGRHVNTILQAAFFQLTDIIPIEVAVACMKDAVRDTYGRKGDKVVALNCLAIDRGLTGAHPFVIPADWADASGDDVAPITTGRNPELVRFVDEILRPVNAQRGDSLPVSAFVGRESGTYPLGSAAYEKRGIAIDVPQWIPENCIQCNFCAYICPHAAIRPVALCDEDLENAPKQMPSKPLSGMAGHHYTLTVSPLDCTGCASCVNICPGLKGNSALRLEPLESQLSAQEVFDYANALPDKPEVLERFKISTVKGTQYRRPLLEFSGACAGCGETPYAKLVTQLWGERMYIANATGCSSIWGCSAPSMPYAASQSGRGPAWQNSLFEDNAEFGYGLLVANKAMRAQLADAVEKLIGLTANGILKAAARRWLETFGNGNENAAAAEEFKAVLAFSGSEGEEKRLAERILADADYLAKKSFWLFGGDGWAYDIGFGGLDHVLASGEDVNVLVLDTEVYSNTGGQASKATPTGAIAQFAAAGKKGYKKDLSLIAMSYGNVYVAQVAQGADYNQCLKAFLEAESHPGPSIIIAYAPCITHGIRGGMGQSPIAQKNAVLSGYWNLFRYDPRKKDAGANPFVLDSKAPTLNYRDFLMNEVRFSSLLLAHPDRAESLFAEAELFAKEKYETFRRMAAAHPGNTVTTLPSALAEKALGT